jgi:hypothetical protein
MSIAQQALRSLVSKKKVRLPQLVKRAPLRVAPRTLQRLRIYTAARQFCA